MRGLIAVPAHAAFGIIMGHYIGISKHAKLHNKKTAAKKYLL